MRWDWRHLWMHLVLVVSLAPMASPARAAELPAPVLDSVFPAGGTAGQSVDVTLVGSNLQGLRALRCSAPGVHFEMLEAQRWRLTFPVGTPPGQYELRAEGAAGVSGPRSILISRRIERLEVEPNDSPELAAAVQPVDVVVHGRIEKGGDVDCFRFEARRGQRVVVECWAERIDSRLRAILEIFDSTGRRLAVNRGYFGVDPLIDFRAPADGAFVVKVQDLISSGSADHVYRLDIDTGPRVAFVVPSVVERGKPARVSLYGWNLAGTPTIAPNSADSVPSPSPTFDRVDVEIPASRTQAEWPLPVRLSPAQAVLEGFAFDYPGSHAAIVIGLTDVPVSVEQGENHAPQSAQSIAVPSEMSGQLVTGDERDWFAFQAQRGEVLHLEGIAQRIGSPVDLQISLFDATGTNELVQFGDTLDSVGGSISTSHFDPVGRWVAPGDGRYLIAVQSLTGGLESDARRIYRLSVRREEPDFQVVAIPRRDDRSGLVATRNGREAIDLVAIRRRGMQGPIRVSAKNLPAGVECPDVCLGPLVDRATMVMSVERNTSDLTSSLQLEATAAAGAHNVRRDARSAALVRGGLPTEWSRLTWQLPLVVTGDAPLRISADAHEPLQHHLYGKLRVRHSPGGVVDLAVRVERQSLGHAAPVKLVGVGLPESCVNPSAVIPVGESQGYVSFYLPPALPVGPYSLVVRAETTYEAPDKKSVPVVVYSNSVTVDVQPAVFLVQADPFAPKRARRGETIQISYSAQRRNGFIRKIHTELAAPGRITDVEGLRARGETFVGQTDRGSLQIVVNDDAPLGPRNFLRLFSVGTVEDEPIYQGSSLFSLEIVE